MQKYRTEKVLKGFSLFYSFSLSCESPSWIEIQLQLIKYFLPLDFNPCLLSALCVSAIFLYPWKDPLKLVLSCCKKTHILHPVNKFVYDQNLKDSGECTVVLLFVCQNSAGLSRLVKNRIEIE